MSYDGTDRRAHDPDIEQIKIAMAVMVAKMDRMAQDLADLKSDVRGELKRQAESTDARFNLVTQRQDEAAQEQAETRGGLKLASWATAFAGASGIAAIIKAFGGQ